MAACLPSVSKPPSVGQPEKRPQTEFPSCASTLSALLGLLPTHKQIPRKHGPAGRPQTHMESQKPRGRQTTPTWKALCSFLLCSNPPHPEHSAFHVKTVPSPAWLPGEWQEATDGCKARSGVTTGPRGRAHDDLCVRLLLTPWAPMAPTGVTQKGHGWSDTRYGGPGLQQGRGPAYRALCQHRCDLLYVIHGADPQRDQRLRDILTYLGSQLPPGVWFNSHGQGLLILQVEGTGKASGGDGPPHQQCGWAQCSLSHGQPHEACSLKGEGRLSEDPFRGWGTRRGDVKRAHGGVC